jgi:hypothetical protein
MLLLPLAILGHTLLALAQINGALTTSSSTARSNSEIQQAEAALAVE